MGFYLFHHFIAYYGLMIVLGIGIAFLVGQFLIRRFNLSINNFIILSGCAGLAAIIGAKILYLWVSFDSIDWSRMLNLAYLNSWMSGGFVFYGGLIAGIGVLLILNHFTSIPVLTYLEVALPCIPIVHGFGRIGCSLAGCCYGIPYNGFGAITYHHNPLAPDDIQLFPVQALEATIELMIAALLFALIIRYGYNIWFLYLYIALYSILRFFLEYLRYDSAERGHLWSFSTSQLISIILLLLISFAAYNTFKRKKKAQS